MAELKTSGEAEAEPAARPPAKFVTGSTMRHVVVMTSTASVGLVAIFMVDFVDMFFLSLLGEVEVAAAIGYAGTILFFNISLCVGLTIAATALVSRALGAGDQERAGKLAMASLVFMGVVTVAVAIALFPALPFFLRQLGAEGRALDLALSYLQIMLPSLPILGLGMCCSGLLRALGDAKRAMYVTLAGGLVNAVLDPIFIFGLALGVDGAAMASVASRFALCAVGFHGVVVVHNLIGRIDLSTAFRFVPALSGIAVPAVLTNIATPVGNAYITASIAPFGDGAVAGWAIVGRLIPVAFGVIFALSGAVGPILGQNLGARRFDRVKQAYRDALIFCLGYVFAVWLLLLVAQGWIIVLFGVEGEAAALIRLFCTFVAPTFLFNGALFVSNAAFNNLGFPTYSTVLNWGKATIGTIPFVLVGAHFGAASGVLIGQGVGAVLFGALAAVLCGRMIATLEERPPPDPGRRKQYGARLLWPFSSGKSATAGG